MHFSDNYFPVGGSRSTYVDAHTLYLAHDPPAHNTVHLPSNFIKMPGQNQTSRTGSAAPVKPCDICSVHVYNIIFLSVYRVACFSSYRWGRGSYGLLVVHSHLGTGT